MKKLISILLMLMIFISGITSCSDESEEYSGYTPPVTTEKEESPIEDADPYETAVGMVEDYKTEMLENYPSNPVDENVVDIILFAGQSNSSGRATEDEIEGVGEEFVTVDKSKAFTFYNNRYTEPMAIEEPILGNGTEDKFYGYIPSFLNGYYDNTGRKVCACFKSVGGMMMNSFFPYTVDESGNEIAEAQKFYNEMVEYINYAKTNLTANGYTTGHIFMVWCQGESEAAYYGFENEYANYVEEQITEYEDKITYYKNSFNRIFETLQSQTGLEKAFFVRIGHSNNRKEALRNQCIIEAQSQLCRENDDYIMVSTFFAGAKCYKAADGTVQNLMRDASHYTLKAYLTVGKEAAVNTSIYVNSNFTEKPMLVEYHRVYLDSQGVWDDGEYENEYERFIYRP